VIGGDWEQYLYLNRRLRDLERRERKARSDADYRNSDDANFKVRATCPPSTSVLITGGWACYPPSFYDGGLAWFAETQTVDLADEDAAPFYWPYTFTNAYWYMPLVVGLYLSGEPSGSAPFQLYGTGTPRYLTGGGNEEFETATEAEGALDTFIDDNVCESCLALCRLVLRNNGNTIDPNQFQPIDQVNRGRSYIWGDIRTSGYWL